MHVAMAGLDYKTSGVTTRETFAVQPERMAAVLATVLSASRADGCALLSTCNRTEIYLSYSGETPDCPALLCAALGVDIEQHRRYFVARRERQAVVHLMRVAAGMESSVLGDDQILTQARSAIEYARQAGASDPVLETLFRCAVTAGKKVKTTVPFRREGASVAAEAVGRLERHFGGLRGRTALVIGNGVVGRLAAQELLQRGCAVTMTLRKRSPIKSGPPEGCETINFDDRAEAAAKSDFVISATSSPHLTLTADQVPACERQVRIFVDLAVPRDLDPALAELPGVQLWNVDDLRPEGETGDNQDAIALADEIIDEEAGRFEMWRRNRWLRLSGRTGNPDFPVFINLHGSTVLIAGGGKVAARRADVLLNFGAQIKMVAPELSDDAK
ncbi:MAG: glutamyl-tRNA reductase, partial [Planctomycetes bacterium]|nr:glutamyl-tRNA reductase [Planctomycetota bacterium]